MKNQLYIQWQASFNTGVAILDEQHRGIIATINSLYYFIQTGYGLEALQPTLKILKEYMQFHFITEEMILRELNYPETDRYIMENKQVLYRLKNIAQDATAHKDPKLLLQFLKDWWPDHAAIQHKDFEFLIK